MGIMAYSHYGNAGFISSAVVHTSAVYGLQGLPILGSGQ